MSATAEPPAIATPGVSIARATRGRQPRLTGSGSAPGLRRVVYAAALVLAVAVVLQCGLALSAHERSRSHQELLGPVLALPQMVQTMGRDAALLALWPQTRLAGVAALRQALLVAEEDMRRLPEQWAAAQWNLATENVAVALALEAWQDASLRLQAHGHALAALHTAPSGSATGSATEEAQWQQRQRRFQAEVEVAQEAAQTLLNALRVVNRDHMHSLKDELRYGGLSLLLLVAALALGVAEPAARWMTLRAQRQAEKSLESQRLALVAEHTQALVLITDANDQIVWTNGAFSEITGYGPEAALGQNPLELLHHPRVDETVLLQLRQAVSAGQGTRLEGLHRDSAGRDLWLDIDLRALHDEQGRLNGFVRVATDVTERRVLQDQVSEHARTDSLTALPNRAVVMERLERAIVHAQQHPEAGFAVLFMDFDRFKQVNDTLGHSAGDELLRQIAQRLTHALRPGDAVARLQAPRNLAARLGGDEFVVVLERVNGLDVVTSVAQRLLAELARPYQLGTMPVHSSVSIGVVLIEGHTTTQTTTQAKIALSAQDVLRDADTAMYEAKRGGRGRWVLFDTSMREKVLQSLALEQDLRVALEQDQLSVVYQPVMDLATRRLTGVEALVRWSHPTRGMVPPLDFIPVAEESGLIDAVGAVVLRQACTQFVGWRKSLGGSAPRQLAVNLSRAQLKRAALVSDLRALLLETGMQPEWLQLEVTESLAAQDERVQLTLRELKNLGVKLALDDFGTGYSSLACLHLMPVDTVKVDRSFVQHAETVEYHRVLIEATIRVARTLGMTTVAEGIETESQAVLMLQLDCDRGQGYLYSKPISGAAIEAFVRAKQEACV